MATSRTFENRYHKRRGTDPNVGWKLLHRAERGITDIVRPESLKRRWLAPSPRIQLLTDCVDDLARNKVSYKARVEFGRGWEIPEFQRVPSFQTHVLGRLLENYVQRDEIPTVYIANSAPRNGNEIVGKSPVESHRLRTQTQRHVREGSIGGSIFAATLKNGSVIVGTNGPGVLDPIKDQIDEIYEIDTKKLVRKGILNKTQFRSFSWFAPIAKQYIDGNPKLLKTKITDIDKYIIPFDNDFVWLSDSFGNIKLTKTQEEVEAAGIEPGDLLILQCGDYIIEATYDKSLFPLPDDATPDDIRCYPGSDLNSRGEYYCELAIAYVSVSRWIELNGTQANPDRKYRTPLTGGETFQINHVVKAIDRPAYEAGLNAIQIERAVTVALGGVGGS